MNKVLVFSLLIPIFLFSADNRLENDKNYNDALLYLNGDKGVTMVTRTMPSCPYEKCAEVENKDGTKTYSFAKKDLQRATFLLKASLQTNSNVMAAKEMVKLLQRRMNWKEPKPDGYLKAKLEEDLGISYQEYKVLFLSSIELLDKKNICEGISLKAEIVENGYLGIKSDKQNALSYYVKAAKVCNSDSYLGMVASQKVKNLSK
ncbi:MAG: hypothetical protein PHE67_00805 [Campylobacterales bacterium]|nr:hypothetical protein [Campylobacterales bacterium]